MASDTRRKMLIGAARLLAERGLQETSFSTVLNFTGAPRGSIYHHFPNGKDEMVASALDLAGTHALAVMGASAGTSAVQVTEHFVGLWREVLNRSEFRAGCSIVAVTVATDSSDLRQRAGSIFKAWRDRLSELLQEGGVENSVAEGFAVTLIAATEGAVVIARAEQSIDAFELVAQHLIAHARTLTN